MHFIQCIPPITQYNDQIGFLLDLLNKNINFSQLQRSSITKIDNKDVTLLQKITEGSYGVVKLYKHNETSELLVLKEYKYENPETFWNCCNYDTLAEIAFYMTFEHPAIPTFRGLMFKSSMTPHTMESPKLITDYRGTCLVDFLRKLTPKTEFRVDLVRQLLEIVAFLHEQSIVHCDLHLFNIVVNNSAKLSLIDFGKTFKVGEQATDRISDLTIDMLTIPGNICPEFWLEDATHPDLMHADLWSVAIAAYTILVRFPKELASTKSTNSAFTWMLCEFWPLFETKNPCGPESVRNFYDFIAYGKRKNPNHVFKQDSVISDFLRQIFQLDPQKRQSAKQLLKHPIFDQYPVPKL